jgi:hypothetical protein
VFTHPEILKRLSKKVDWWAAKKGNEVFCLWPVTMPDGKQIEIPFFAYWVGPIWSRRISEIPAHRWLAMSTEIYEGFIRVFIECYGAITASLSLDLLDIRVFDWWNYHAPNKPRFKIQPRYTARLRNLQELTEQQIRNGYRELRRRELRRMAGHGMPERVTDWTLGEIIGLYTEVMGRQGIDVPDSTKNEIAALVDVAFRGMGDVIAFRDHQSGELASVVLLLEANHVANMVLNLTSNRWRDYGMQAWSVHHSICAAQARGADVFDFNGANSPTRGDDKHSYGATPELYFDIFYPSFPGASALISTSPH